MRLFLIFVMLCVIMLMQGAAYAFNLGGGLTGLAGAGGPGGAFSPQAQALQQQQNENRAIALALQQYAKQHGNDGSVPTMMQMVTLLSKSGLPPDQQYQALQQYQQLLNGGGR